MVLKVLIFKNKFPDISSMVENNMGLLFYVLATLFVIAYYVKYQKEIQAKASDEKKKRRN